MVNAAPSQAAPDELENVRTLLNSWLIPNDTRQADDRFATYAKERELPSGQRETVRRLRDDLRAVVEHSADTADVLNRWVDQLEIRPQVADSAVGFRHRAGHAGDIVAAALVAVDAGRWPRLKACPDCRWVFYDHSRNGSKRWCLMTAGGPDGRSCGSIAKVRAHRERSRRG